jgi:putative pyoverdin transport system ATP-binding/permease protein
MKDNILNPLGMNHTVLFRKQAGKDLATGYKAGFLRPLEYIAPVYRGNTPAGYIITCADDMAEWLKVQMGTAPIDSFYRKIVAQSHNDSYDYSNGWNIYRISDSIKFSHGGVNPNYSSFIEFRPPEKLGIILLLNSNSGFASGIGEGIINIIHGRGRIPERLYDMNIDYDAIACLFIMGIGIIFGLTVRFTVKRYQSHRKFSGIHRKNMPKFFSAGVFLIGILLLYGFLPKIVFGYDWSFLAVWGPVTILIALHSVLVELLMAYVFLFNYFFFEGKNKKFKFSIKKMFSAKQR